MGASAEETEKSSVQTQRSLSGALVSINEQAPLLTYFGLAFWMAWNTIAFSGSFWFHDTDSSIRVENFVLIHLISSSITLITFALLSKRIAKLVMKNWFVLLGGVVAFGGSLLIIVTRESLYPSEPLFYLGACLSGPGTTVLFMRSASLLSALPPRKSILMLAGNTIVASLIFFTLNSCGNEFATVLFALLPFFAVALFSLSNAGKTKRNVSPAATVAFSPRLGVFIFSIVLCSAAFEIAQSFILIGIPPVYNASSSVTAQFVSAGGMTVIIIATLLSKDQGRYGICYSIVVCALMVVLLAIALFSPNSAYAVNLAACAKAICSCYNVTIWAMLAYIAFQAKSDGIRICALGNASLSTGTVLGSGLIQLDFQYDLFDEESMHLLLIILVLVVLVDLVFAFSDKQINKLLAPIDPALLEEKTAAKDGKRLGHYVQTCENIAQACHLSKRESEMFIALARGKTAQEIADHEVLSVYTVRAHIRSIYAKLDVHSKQELVALVESHLNDS